MRTGIPLTMQMRAKPTSKRATYDCATVTITFAVSDRDAPEGNCPSREISEQIAFAYIAIQDAVKGQRAAAAVVGATDGFVERIKAIRDANPGMSLADAKTQAEAEGHHGTLIEVARG